MLGISSSISRLSNEAAHVANMVKVFGMANV
nr:MAG TPA: hypothetical protein [Caudoviricetes sp.]